MDFEKICMMFTMQEPFYGILLSSMERIADPRVGTIGVKKSGNVFKLVYNPAFMEPLSIEAQLVILRHEVLHLAFNHFSIWENNDVSPGEREIRNWACDMEVNSYIDISKIKDQNPVTSSVFGWQTQLGTMEYYKRLKQFSAQQQQPQPQTQQAQNPLKECNGGQGGNDQNQQSQQPQSQDASQSQDSNPSEGQSQQESPSSNASFDDEGGIPQEIKEKMSQFDDHSEWPTCSNEAEQQVMQQIIDDMVALAADECEKGRGTLPSEMRVRIESIRNKKKPKPAADWKRYFRRYLGHEFTEFIRKSKKRESRRFPDAAGNRHRRKSHILVAIDTSGSVSMPEYKEFMGQIRTLTATADFHVVECDARIQHEYEFKGHISEELHGGGGTDFQPVVDMYNQNKRKYDALVYFTDGYCPVPKDTPKDTLWVISSKGVNDRTPFRQNGASVVKIPSRDI